jgi:hypothetical protein
LIVTLEAEMTAHDHLVTIDSEAKCVRISRILPSGERVLFTEYALPDESDQGWTDEVVKLAHVLGEDLFMDSPITRKRFSL